MIGTSSDRQFPAGPDIAWSVTWDSGAITAAEERVAPQGLHGHGVDIEHSTGACSTSIMRVGGYLSPVDEFTPADVVQIRIHRKP